MSDERRGGLRQADLVGTWRLLRWQTVTDAGPVAGPLGETPMGYVVYTHDGRMVTTISEAGRTPIGGDLLSGPDAGRLEAFASFVAYAGTFRVDGQIVVHTVEMSLFPDWVGSEQRRSVQLTEDGRRLTLSTQLAAGGRSGRQVLTWERL